MCVKLDQSSVYHKYFGAGSAAILYVLVLYVVQTGQKFTSAYSIAGIKSKDYYQN
jgi:hypothetical protein